MEPEGKNQHIRNLMRQINSQGQVLHAARVVLFDDRQTNIDMARKAGYVAFHCPKGFNRNIWQTFVKSCGPHSNPYQPLT